MSLLFHKRTLNEVLGTNTRVHSGPVVLSSIEIPVLGGRERVATHTSEYDSLRGVHDKDVTGCLCEDCKAGKGQHILFIADDGITFQHACSKMDGGRIGLPDHFASGLAQCPICGQSA